MTTTVVRVVRGEPRASLYLKNGLLQPRLIERSASTARVALVAGGAMLLGGDRVRLDIHVGEGCLLEVQDVGGTVAYGADGRTSYWSVRVALEHRSVLLWNGQPLIVSDGADVRRDMDVDLADGAVACIRETVVLGRHGESGGALTNRTAVHVDARPLVREELSARGGAPEPGVLGHARVYDVVGLYGARAAPAPGTLSLEGPGSIRRFLGAATHESTIESTWDAWRAQAIQDRRTAMHDEGTAG